MNKLRSFHSSSLQQVNRAEIELARKINKQINQLLHGNLIPSVHILLGVSNESINDITKK